jgi:hypothetical protein
MPSSSTTPGYPSACDDALEHVAFRYTDSVGTRDQFSIAAQWLACTSPCRRFADILADICARLGVDVDRYSFNVRDLHPLLLAGLPVLQKPAQMQTHAPQQGDLFDHLVGAGKKGVRNLKAKRLGRLEIEIRSTARRL